MAAVLKAGDRRLERFQQPMVTVWWRLKVEINLLVAFNPAS